jgi:hypothetical protein
MGSQERRGSMSASSDGHYGEDCPGEWRILKRSLSERDICTKFITPAARWAGWDVMSQIREEYCSLDWPPIF